MIAIIPTADRQRATVEVRVGFDELDSRILPDMGVKVAFHDADADSGDTPVSGVAVPATAVRESDGKQIVYIFNEGRAERRAVAIAGERGDSVIVRSGLAPGESVIVDGPRELADGAEVRQRAE